ncbi:MAG: 30S ribosomal protein S5 [Planctomycetota bacterium]
MGQEAISSTGLNLEERVIDIWRCATVVKGGKRFSFSAMSVVGNGAGIVGIGYGKAREVPNAIEKAVKDAKKHLVRVSTFGTTIPHEVRGEYGASSVVMLPALPGTGVIAGSAVRAVLECIGVSDALTKSVGGSNNSKNLVKAAINGLLRLRTRETVAFLRNKEIPPDAQLAASLTAAATAKRHSEREGRKSGQESGTGGGRNRRPRFAGGHAASLAAAKVSEKAVDPSAEISAVKSVETEVKSEG